MQRRILTVVGCALAIMALTSTAAFAHLCYNTSRSDTGNANAARSPALTSGPEFFAILDEVGCSAEADAIAAAVEELGLQPENVLVHDQALMASGVIGTSHSTDGKGIDHLLPIVPELEAALACAGFVE